MTRLAITTASVGFTCLIPQNTDKTDVVRRLALDMPCKRNAADELKRVANDFSSFANFEGDFGPVTGLSTFHAKLSFASGAVTPGRNIPITNTVSNNGGFYRTSTTVTTSVDVRDVGPYDFTFDTAPDHPFYPGTIQFGTTNMGPAEIKFSINIYAHFNGTSNWAAFNFLGGGMLETKIWRNLLNNVKQDCAH